MTNSSNEAWARTLTANARLGDARRNGRAAKVLQAMVEYPGASLAACAGGNSAALEQYYRHARSPKVPPDVLLDAACTATAAEIACDEAQQDIVLVGDTTSLSYRHAVAAQLGPMGHVKESVNRGWMVHTVLALDAHSGEIVGPIEQLWWSREEAEHGKGLSRNKRPYITRESFKWEYSAGKAVERLGLAGHRAVFVTDRESDVYEYLADTVGEGRRFVARSCWNRCIEGEQTHLYQECAAAPILAQLTLCIPQKGGRKARSAKLELRAASVTLRPPKDVASCQPNIDVNIVCLQEVCVPEDSEGVCWMLFTSETIDTPEQAISVVRLYTRRWRVEEFHKFWKSDGTRVEHLRMATPDNLRRIAVLLAFAACRLMRLRDAAIPPTSYLSLLSPEAARPEGTAAEPKKSDSCDHTLTAQQWQMLWALTAAQPIPQTPPSRRWASLAVAKLGDWTDTKRTGRPGYRAYVRGWRRLLDACDAAHVAAAFDLLPTAVDTA